MLIILLVSAIIATVTACVGAFGALLTGIGYACTAVASAIAGIVIIL